MAYKREQIGTNYICKRKLLNISAISVITDDCARSLEKDVQGERMSGESQIDLMQKHLHDVNHMRNILTCNVIQHFTASLILIFSSFLFMHY